MKKIASALLLLAAISTPAFAADGGYVGFKFGSANKSVNTVSETNSSWGIFGGFQFNQNVALEVGYTDFGTVAGGLIKFTGFDVAAVGTLPINQQFSLFGRLGMASVKEDFSLAGLSASRTAPTFGIGGQFNVNQQFGIRLAYDRYAFGDGTIFNQGNIGQTSVAAVVKF